MIVNPKNNVTSFSSVSKKRPGSKIHAVIYIARSATVFGLRKCDVMTTEGNVLQSSRFVIHVRGFNSVLFRRLSDTPNQCSIFHIIFILFLFSKSVSTSLFFECNVFG